MEVCDLLMDKMDLWFYPVAVRNLIAIGKGTLTWLVNPSHSHDEWELVYYLSGQGETTVNDKSIFFKRGVLVLYPPGLKHEERAEGDYSSFWLRFKKFPYVAQQLLVLQDDDLETFGNLLELLYRSYHRPNGQMRAEATFEFLLLLIRENTAQPKRPEVIVLMENILIDNVLSPSVNLKNAFKKIPISHHHLIRIFKKSTGLAPLQYLIELRLREAGKLLATTSRSVKEIAEILGFSDPYYFSRLFKNKMGLSPLHFRRRETK
jgi:AraC-like DNA-binding protein